MRKERYSKLLDDVAKDQIPVGLNLAPNILSRIQKSKGKTMKTRLSVFVPAVTVLLILAVVTFTVPVVAQTILHWIGYIPGFGLVQNDRVRSLNEPVQTDKDGITLTIEELTASSDKTILKYSLSGVQNSMIKKPFLCPGSDPERDSEPVVTLPNGKTLDWQGMASDSNGPVYHFSAFFSAIPADVTDITFSLNCNWKSDAGPKQWDWKISLALIDKPKAQITLAPVIEVPPAQSTADAQDGKPANLLAVDQIVPLEDGYILSGALAVKSTPRVMIDESDGFLDDMTILDAKNNSLEFISAPGEYAVDTNSSEDGKVHWQIEVLGKEIAWPITLTVNSVSAVTDPYPSSNFTVDVDDANQADQEWPLGKDIQMGEKTVHLVSLKRLKMPPTFDGYSLNYLYDPSLDFSFTLKGCEMNGGGGGGGLINPGETASRAISCKGGAPTGIVQITVTGRGIKKIQGPWSTIVGKPATQ